MRVHGPPRRRGEEGVKSVPSAVYSSPERRGPKGGYEASVVGRHRAESSPRRPFSPEAFYMTTSYCIAYMTELHRHREGSLTLTGRQCFLLNRWHALPSLQQCASPQSPTDCERCKSTADVHFHGTDVHFQDICSMIVAIQSSMTLLPRLVQGDRRSWEAVASSLPVASLLKDRLKQSTHR